MATVTPDANHQQTAPSEPSTPTPRIAICIATYKRPALLQALLDGLEAIEPVAGHALEVRIVDNDAAASARNTVTAHAAISRWQVRYITEPARNIACARNRALDMGPAELLAFIDDDEVPRTDWLTQLVAALGDGIDLVVGSVAPQYEHLPRRWIENGQFHHKPAGRDGGRVSWACTRTSNTLLRGSWVYERGYRFDARYGRSGAEDTDLFRRLHAHGAEFAAAPRAVVDEHIHADQCRLGWLLRRHWRNGINYERVLRGVADQPHALLRFVGRTARAFGRLAIATPALLRGRADHSAKALLELARAGGGLVGWLAPHTLERHPGYRSSGCEH